MMKSSRMSRLAMMAACALATLLTACTQGENSTKNVSPKDKVYKGKLTVVADEGLSDIMKQEAEVFSFLYDSVQLELSYATEQEALTSFRERKADAIVLARDLTQAERDAMKTTDTLYAREINVAFDAVALVGNKSFDDENLTLEALKDYLNPDTKTPNRPSLIFDRKNSSSVSYIMARLGYTGAMASQVYAAASPEEVISYVEQHPNAIGFIPFSAISDLEDERVQDVRKRIKILSLRVKNSEGEDKHISVNQSDIADGAYPLIRKVNVIIHFGYEDNLPWLFANYMYRGKGSKVFLKAGLIPARMPEREINVNTGAVPASR